jgi:hypothetical protein
VNFQPLLWESQGHNLSRRVAESSRGRRADGWEEEWKAKALGEDFMVASLGSFPGYCLVTCIAPRTLITSTDF